MFICGFGPNRPLRQPKAPEEAVAGNRRVEILLIPEAMRSIGQILEGFKS
jgi:flagellar motor protein MotB